MKKLFALLVLAIIVFTTSGCNETPKSAIQLKELETNEVAYYVGGNNPKYVKIKTYDTYTEAIENPEEFEFWYFVAGSDISSIEEIDDGTRSTWTEYTQEELQEGYMKFYEQEQNYSSNFVTYRLKISENKYKYFAVTE